jgi:predicted component of type VI protein secretion system
MPHRFTIGRDRSSDIAIADDSVSRTHAEIWLEDDGTLMLADHGSSNGTELIRAGETSALSKAAVLPGDQVRFGGVTLTVKDLIDAIETKSPGALTGSGSGSGSRSPQEAKPAPPLPPPLPPQQNSPPLPRPNVALPPPPERAVAPPPLPSTPERPQPLRPAAPPPPPPPLPPIPDRPPAERAAAPPASPLVRCECGAIKKQDQVCPACHR